jgi:hypothetical protein
VMSAIDNFALLLETTEVMKQVLKSLKDEPAHLLGDICREYQITGQSVPDHRLQLKGYLGRAALTALLSVKMIKRQSEGTLSIYSYDPTSEGLEQYERLKAGGFYKR